MPSVIINIRFGLDAEGGVGSVGYFGTGFRASMQGQSGAQGRYSIQPFTSYGVGSVGSTGQLSVVLGRSAFTLSATGSTEDNGRAILVAPAFRSLFGVYEDTAPLFSLRATSQEVIDAIYRAYAVNVKNAALTEYTGFPFNHIVRFNGQTIAFSDAGAVTLGGGLDDLAEIDAVAELAPSDFETAHLKRMPYIYVGAKTNAAMLVSMIADEAEMVASLTATNGRTRRAKMARGVKARYWAAKIQNKNGEDFAVDSIEYLPMTLGRKV